MQIQPATNHLHINWRAGFDAISLYKDAQCEDKVLVVVPPKEPEPGPDPGNWACFNISKLPKILSFKGTCKDGWCY